jgi:hypothetical protein
MELPRTHATVKPTDEYYISLAAIFGASFQLDSYDAQWEWLANEPKEILKDMYSKDKCIRCANPGFLDGFESADYFDTQANAARDYLKVIGQYDG